MAKKIIKILSFDPGLTCTGWALTEYDLVNGTAYIPKRGQIEGRKALTKNKEKLVIFPSQIIQLQQIEEDIIHLTRYKPDYVVTEAAYYQPGRLSAYAALVLCINTIERVIYSQLYKPIFRLAPQCVKRLTANEAQATKMTIQEAILSNKDITLKETKQNPINKMSEHEADAIAVMWAFIKNELPSI